LAEPIDDLPIVGSVSRFQLGRPVRDFGNVADLRFDGLDDLALFQQWLSTRTNRG
jgi:hypothetical protein